MDWTHRHSSATRSGRDVSTQYDTGVDPQNSVVSKSVKNRTLKNVDLAKESIRSGRINDGEVRTEDIGKDEVRTRDIKDGEVKSVDIRNGNVRAAELGTIVERTKTIAISNGETDGANVQCDPGDQVTGGGAEWGTPEEGAGIVQSHRVENGWEVTAEHNAGGGAKQLTVSAYCLQA